MASVDGSRSLLGASDEIYDIVCGPCKTDNVNKEAKLYCEQCQEHLCNACQNVHRKLKVTKSHNILSGRHMPMVLAGMKIQSVKQHYINLDDDRQCALISGCSFMPSGDLVLCDHYNSKLKLLDHTFKMKDVLSLNAGPWSVSIIDNSTVIITLPGSKQLQYVQLVPHMKAGRAIQLDKKCYGVAVAGNEIYVSCYNLLGGGEVRVLGLSGNLKRKLGVDKDGLYRFQRPYNLAVNATGKKIFVSDNWKFMITCMKPDGNIIYQYKDDDLRGPAALFADAGDNTFVCGYTSHNVQVITPEGRENGSLISANDIISIQHPYSITFREADNVLVVGCYNQNYIFCCKLSH